MKQIRFWGQPMGSTELTTTISEEVWTSIRERLDNGENLNTIYQELVEQYHIEVGMTRLFGIYEAFDFEVSDCDCEEAKKRPIQENED
jgi:hypothetical protein